MKFVIGLVGAILGVFVGGAAAVLFVADVADDGLGEFFVALFAVPVGLLVGAGLGIVSALLTLRFLRSEGADPVRQRRRKRLLVAGLALGLPGLIAGIFTIASAEDQAKYTPPPDQRLLINFQRHRQAFDRISEMALADRHLHQVGENWTDPPDPTTLGIPAERIAQYRRLLGVVGTPGGFGASEHPEEIQLRAWGLGSAVSSDTDKGYAYLEKSPKQVLASLDQCKPPTGGRSDYRAYRHIADHWYMYYQFIPD